MDLKGEAENYVPPETKVVSDLDKVSVLSEIETFKGMDKDGNSFSYKYLEEDGERYRVPTSVIQQIKVLLEDNPKLLTVKVKKTGKGMSTVYQVIPVD